MRTASKNTRELYEHLRSEVIAVHYRWKAYNQLFSPDAEDFLFKAIPTFAFSLRVDLLDAIVLALSRLIDPATSLGKHKNVSLRQLINAVIADCRPDLVKAMEEDLAHIQNKCDRVKSWRDKWAAHRDMQAVLGSVGKLGFSHFEVEEALVHLRSFMNRFESEYQDPEPQYVYQSQMSPIEFGQFVQEAERLRIHAPVEYDKLAFHDDGGTLLEMLKKAHQLK